MLARPYPRAVAGTPLGWSFDPAGRCFELDYAPVPAGGTLEAGTVTEVFLPRRHFGGGYEISAKGADVISAPDESVLRLGPRAGAEQVNVVVTGR